MTNTIGDMILKFRTDKGLKQKELAALAGINRMSIGNYERGTRTPSADILKKIADALEVPINKLLGISESEDSVENDFDISNILNKDFIDEATNLFTIDQKTAFNNMYFQALKNIGIIEGLMQGDMHYSFVDSLYLSVSFTEIFRNFNNEIQKIISNDKTNFSSKDINSSIELLAKYTHQAYLLLRKNMIMLEESDKYYSENLSQPFFEEEIFSEYLNK